MSPRSLQRSDFQHDALKLLEGSCVMSREAFEERLAAINADELHHVVLMEASSSPPHADNVATRSARHASAIGSLVVENKFIHECGRVGHVDSSAVSAEQCGGEESSNRLLEHLIDLARRHGCYKVLVDCLEADVAFYVRSGFERKGAQMAMSLVHGGADVQVPSKLSWSSIQLHSSPFRARALRAADRAGYLGLLEQLTTVTRTLTLPR